MDVDIKWKNLLGILVVFTLLVIWVGWIWATIILFALFKVISH